MQESFAFFYRGFFVYLSGLVFFYTYPEMRSLADYAKFVRKKFARFLPAYLLFAVLNVAARQMAAAWGGMPAEISGAAEDFLLLLYRPTASSSFYLWYVYLLLGYSLLAPLFVWLVRRRLFWLVLVALIFYLTPYFVRITDWFLLHLQFRYALPFALGGLFIHQYARYTRYLDRWFWIALVALLSVQILWWAGRMDAQVALFLETLLALPAVHGAVRKWGMRSRLLAMLGQYTFVIYLAHLLLMAPVKLLIGRLWPCTGFYFVPHALVLFVTGLAGPILLKRLVFRRIPYLDRITN